MTSNPCGIYWYTIGAVTGRIINDSDEVFATGQQGSVEVASGTYRLQVQCVVGGDWITVEEVDHVADETLCNCCDIMAPYDSHTVENLDHLTSGCFELPASLTFPTFFGYDWTGNVIATPCSSSYRLYSPVTPITGIANIQAAACWTGSYLGNPHWVALWYAWLAIDVVYSSSPGGGSFVSVQLWIAFHLTDGSTSSTGAARRQWQSGFICPPERDWAIQHIPAQDLDGYPPWVGVTTENLIINTQ